MAAFQSISTSGQAPWFTNYIQSAKLSPVQQRFSFAIGRCALTLSLRANGHRTDRWTRSQVQERHLKSFGALHRRFQPAQIHRQLHLRPALGPILLASDGLFHHRRLVAFAGGPLHPGHL